MTTARFKDLPNLGFGIGGRPKHFNDLLESSPNIDWLEVISENFLIEGRKSTHYLEQLCDKYTVIPHGVSLSIGSSDPLDPVYCKKLKSLIDKINPPWFSDHLCWTSDSGHNMHNLLPLPYTTEVTQYIADKIKALQDMMGRPFILENVSSYLEFEGSNMPEWEFINLIAEKSDCGILLDVNNVYVSAQNHSFDPMTFINAMPKERVVQYHIAGHTHKGPYLFDTHGAPICDEVWDLFSKTVPIFGDVPVLIERDEDIPSLDEIVNELDYARKLYHDAKAPLTTDLT